MRGALKIQFECPTPNEYIFKLGRWTLKSLRSHHDAKMLQVLSVFASKGQSCCSVGRPGQNIAVGDAYPLGWHTHAAKAAYWPRRPTLHLYKPSFLLVLCDNGTTSGGELT